MPHSQHRIVKAISELYTAPDTDGINQGANRWLSFNDATWQLAQSVLISLINPDLYDTFTEEFEQKLQDLLIEHDYLPYCPEPPVVWGQALNFTVSSQGFSVVSGGGGTWTTNQGWQGTAIGANTNIHIKKAISANTVIEGVTALFQITSGGVHSIRVYCLTPSETNIINATVSSGTFMSQIGEVTVENPSEFRININATATVTMNLRFMAIWGTGSKPL